MLWMCVSSSALTIVLVSSSETDDSGGDTERQTLHILQHARSSGQLRTFLSFVCAVSSRHRPNLQGDLSVWGEQWCCTVPSN